MINFKEIRGNLGIASNNPSQGTQPTTVAKPYEYASSPTIKPSVTKPLSPTGAKPMSNTDLFNSANQIGKNTRASKEAERKNLMVQEFQKKQGSWLTSNANQANSAIGNVIMSTLNWFVPDVVSDSKYVKPIFDWYEKDYEKAQSQADVVNDTQAKQVAGNLLSATIQAVPNALLAIASGGSSLAPQAITGVSALAQAGKVKKVGLFLKEAVEELGHNPMFWTSFAQMTGPTYEKEKANGASEAQAQASALLNGILGSAIEVSGGIETFKWADKGWKQFITQALQEGGEEVSQYTVENLINKAVGTNDAKWVSMDKNQDAVINPKAQAEAGAYGAVVGGIMGGGQRGVAGVINHRSKVLEERKAKAMADKPKEPRPEQAPGQLLLEGPAVNWDYGTYKKPDVFVNKGGQASDDIENVDIKGLPAPKDVKNPKNIVKGKLPTKPEPKDIMYAGGALSKDIDDADQKRLPAPNPKYVDKPGVDKVKSRKEAMDNIISKVKAESSEDRLAVAEIVRQIDRDDWDTNETFERILDLVKKQKYSDIDPESLYPGLKKELKSVPIKLSDDLKQMVDSNDFRKKNFGKITLTKNGRQIDELYMEWNELHPGLFPEEITHPADQLEQLVKVIDSMKKTSHTVGEALSENDIINGPVTDIYAEISRYREAVKEAEKAPYENAKGQKEAPRTLVKGEIRDGVNTDKMKKLEPKKDKVEQQVQSYKKPANLTKFEADLYAGAKGQREVPRTINAEEGKLLRANAPAKKETPAVVKKELPKSKSDIVKEPTSDKNRNNGPVSETRVDGKTARILERLNNEIRGRNLEGQYTKSTDSKNSYERKQVAKIAQIFGADVLFVHPSNADIDDFNGFFDGTTIVISDTATNPMHVVFGHEVMHQLKLRHPSEFNDFAKAFESQLTPEKYARYSKALEEAGNGKNKQYTREDIMEEMIADLSGEMFNDPKLMAKIFVNDQNLGQKVYAIITDMIKTLQKHIGASYRIKDGLKDIKAVEADYVMFMQRTMEVDNDTPFSLKKSPKFSAKKKPMQNTQEFTPEFKSWFGDWEAKEGSKVVNKNGTPKVMYSGHNNIEMYGTKFDPKKATAGGFYATDSPEIASNYAIGKIGVMESFESGSDYRIASATGNLNKKLWQISLDDSQIKIADEFLQEIGYDFKKYVEDNLRYDSEVRGWKLRGGLRDLQTIYKFMDYMGETINYEGNSNFDDLLDAIGLKWNSYSKSQPGVMPIYLNIRKPLDTSKPMPKEIMEEFETMVKSKKLPTNTSDTRWTKDYPLKPWIEEIQTMERTGVETFWATQIPKDALSVFKKYGYDGIKDTGGKKGGAGHAVWIAFDSNQIKSATGNKGTFSEKPDMRYSLKRDSDGNKLTEEQVEYFKDSKVKDENGNLRIMHHGSVEEFSTFLKSKIRSIETDAMFNGFWFTNNSTASPAWTRANHRKKVYLNISNPAPMDVVYKVQKEVDKDFFGGKNLKPESRSTFDEVRNRLQDLGYDGVFYRDTPNINIKELEEKGETTFTKYGKTKEFKYMLKQVDGGVYYIDDWSGDVITGYDDVADFIAMSDLVYVAFESNQIKETSNLNPTSDPDIRYSLKRDSEFDENRSKALKAFGTTGNFVEAGYLLPDGRMLDFSGKKDSGVPGVRWVDHRDIAEIYDDLDNVDAMNKFMSEGNVRMMPESPGLDIVTQPTDKQYVVIKRYVDRIATNDYFNVDFSAPDGKIVNSIEYDGKVNPNKVVSDIQHFFETGSVPRKSVLSQFHYSLKRDSEGNKLTEAQVEFFRDSKVRDSEGNLQVVYHGTYLHTDYGTGIENFSAFKSGTNFGSMRQANGFADYDGGTANRVYPVYLNLKNPMLTIMNPADWSEPIELAYKLHHDGVKYLNRLEGVYDKITGETFPDEEMEDAINKAFPLPNGVKPSGARWKEISDEQFLELFDAEYAYIVFEPNQVKSIFNTTPTSDPDIRYSLKYGQPSQMPAKMIEFESDDVRKGVEGSQGRVDAFKEIIETGNDHFVFMAKDILEPIDVVERDGKYIAYDGNHRLMAYKQIDENHIVPVTIYKDYQEYRNAKNQKRLNYSVKIGNESASYRSRMEIALAENGEYQEVIEELKDVAYTDDPEISYLAQFIKDRPGIFLDLKDVYRNMRDAFGEKGYPYIKEKYLDPFDASKKDYIDTIKKYSDIVYNDVVKDLKIKKNSKESQAIQNFGEGKRQQGFTWEIDEKTGKKYKAFQLVDYTLEDLKEQFPKKWQDIVKASNIMRKVYDDLIDEVNESRRKIYPHSPEKLVLKRNDYFRHYRELNTSFQGLWNVFSSSTNIDPKLAGISEFTAPKSRWASYMQERKMGAYKEDAIGGFLDYIGPASYSINIDPHISKFRVLAKQIAEATTDTRNANNTIAFLHDFANSLAGKTVDTDRWFVKKIGRKPLMALSMLNNRVKKNQILLSVRSALSQVANVPLGIAKIKNPRYLIPGAGDAITSLLHQNDRVEGLYQNSQFISERFHRGLLDRFNTSMLEKPEKMASWLIEGADQMGTKFIWNSTYRQAVDKGIVDPVKYADDITRSLVAGRGIGEVPLLQQSKLFQLVAPFQLEVTNLWHVFGDMKNEKDIGGIFLVLLFNWLFNNGYEEVVGDRVVFDPIDAMAQSLKEGNGVFSAETGGRLAGEVLGNVPLGQTMATLYPEWGMELTVPGTENTVAKIPSRKEIFGDEDPTRYGSGILLAKALQDPFYKLAMPMGGGQLKKTIAGARALAKGEVSKDGEIKYLVDGNPANVAKGLLFGEYGFQEAQEYFDKDRRSLTEKQSEIIRKSSDPQTAYEKLMVSKRMETIDRKINTIKRDDEMSENEKNRQIIKNLKLRISEINSTDAYSEAEKKRKILLIQGQILKYQK